MSTNPIARLTLSYLGIIMAVSLLFSFLIYQISAREVGRGLRRGFDVVYAGPTTGSPGPTTFGIGGPGPNVAEIESVRDEQLETSRTRLKVQLTILNVFVLAAGAGVSYWLAKRHIDPIHEAMEAQGRFTSDAAHELRTPLTAMKTELEVSLRDKTLNAKDARGILESNLEEVNKLTALTNALLRLAHTSNQKDTSHWKQVGLKKLLNGVVAQYQHAALSRNIHIDTSDVTDVKVFGDAEQLNEVVIILLDNALKYGRDGMSIRVASRLHDNNAEITITDQGIGIKASDLLHIFDRFYRADQSRTKLTIPGYGLGLSLAKAIIVHHNGTITAHSEPEVGTTFRISFPISAKSQQKPHNKK